MSEASLEELVSAYLDDELSSTERQRLETELAQNPALQQLLESLQLQRQWFRALPRRSIPSDLSARVLELTQALPTEPLAPESQLADRNSSGLLSSERFVSAINAATSGSPLPNLPPATITPITPATLTPATQADRAASQSLESSPRSANSPRGVDSRADVRSWSLMIASLATVLLALIFWQNVPESIPPLAGLAPSSRSRVERQPGDAIESLDRDNTADAFKEVPKFDNQDNSPDTTTDSVVDKSSNNRSAPSPLQPEAPSIFESAESRQNTVTDRPSSVVADPDSLKSKMDIALGGASPPSTESLNSPPTNPNDMKPGSDAASETGPVILGKMPNPPTGNIADSKDSEVVGIQNIWLVEIPNAPAQLAQLETTLANRFEAAQSLNFRELDTGKLEVLLVDIPQTEMAQRLIEIGQSTEVYSLEYDSRRGQVHDSLVTESVQQKSLDSQSPESKAITDAPEQLAMNMLENSRANFQSSAAQPSASQLGQPTPPGANQSSLASGLPNQAAGEGQAVTQVQAANLGQNAGIATEQANQKSIESVGLATQSPASLSKNQMANTIQSAYLGQQSFLEARKNFDLHDQQPITEQILDKLVDQSRAIRRVDPQSANQSPQLGQALPGLADRSNTGSEPLPSKMGGAPPIPGGGGGGGGGFNGGDSSGRSAGSNSVQEEPNRFAREERSQTPTVPRATGNLPIDALSQGPPENSQRILLLIGRGIDPKSQLRSRADNTNLWVPQSTPATNPKSPDK